jgi:hypothetical protein
VSQGSIECFHDAFSARLHIEFVFNSIQASDEGLSILPEQKGFGRKFNVKNIAPSSLQISNNAL